MTAATVVEQAGTTVPSARVRQAVALLRSALAAAPPDQVVGTDAARMAELLAEAERVAAAGKALYARRVAATDAYQATGHRDAAGWLAGVSGEPVGRARGVLETAHAVAKTPAVEDAYAAGQLSGAQAALVGQAAAVNPSAVAELLAVAKSGSFREVKELAARAKRVVRGEQAEAARERRVHARRYCRTWMPEDGGVRLEAWVTKVDGARLIASLARETDAVFKEAWAAGEREPHERYQADALVRLMGGHGAGSGPQAQVVVRVDAAALRRGAVENGETCEIAGVGPVSIATARELLGDCWLSLLVRDGVDVSTVTGTSRTVRHSLRMALAERDPTCVVPGCPASDHLQIDHWRLDFAKDGPTAMDNLCRLCARHHAMKTNGGWKLKGGPGKWRWVGPLRT